MNESTSEAPRRKSHRVFRLLAMIAAAVVLLVVAALFSLRLSPVRRALLERAIAAVEKSTGGRLGASRLELDPFTGTIVLHDVTFGVAGRKPLLKASRVRVVLDLGSLRRKVPVLRSVVAESLEVALDAPRPVSPSKSDDSLLKIPVEISHFEVHSGSVVPAAPPPGSISWSAAKIELTGAIRAGRLELAIPSALLTLLRPKEPPASFDLKSRIFATADGNGKGELVRIETLELSGSGLSLTGSGEGGSAADSPLRSALQLRLDLAPWAGANAAGILDAKGTITGTTAEPSALVTLSGRALRLGRVSPVNLDATLRADRKEAHLDALTLTTGPGRVDGSGSYRFSEKSGTLRMTASSLAAELIEPFVPANTFADLGVRGTTFDGTLSAEFPPGSSGFEAARGRIDVLWKRGEAVLVKLAALVPASQRPGSFGVDLQASLLPASSGKREFAGRVEAARWNQLAAGHFERADVVLALPDLAAALAELRGLWPAFVPGSEPLSGATGALDARAQVTGAVRSPRVALTASWEPRVSARVDVTAVGFPILRKGELTARFTRLPLATLAPDLFGVISGEASFSGSLQSFQARASVDGTGAGSGATLPVLDRLHAEIEADEIEFRIPVLSAESGERSVSGSGRGNLKNPRADTSARLILSKLAPGLARVELPLTLHEGILQISAAKLSTAAGELVASARIPLGALRRSPALASQSDMLPAWLPDGAVTVEVDSPHIDTAPLLVALDVSGVTERATAALHAAFTIDPADLAASRGALTLSDLALTTSVAQVHALSPLTLRVEGRSLAIERVEFEGGGSRFSLAGSARLAPSFDGPLSLTSLVTNFSLGLNGTLDATFLNPFLVGGLGSGALELAVALSGSPTRPRGSIHLAGKDAVLFWPAPYASKLQSPLIDIALEGEKATLTGEALLNGGRVTLSGKRRPGGDIELNATLADVRYILAYGLGALFSGRLDLKVPAEPGHGQRRLSGSLVMDRGLLDRDVDVDREILTRFFSPPESAGSEASILDSIALDLRVETTTGIRVKNNLADLHATWSALEVTGTLRDPILNGRIDVDRGGTIAAYGQVVRIDRASLTYTGNPAVDPKIDASTSTSFQSEPVGSAGSRDVTGAPTFGAAKSGSEKASIGETLAGGIAGYYGGRLAAGLGKSLGLTSRPALIFGEADPGARLTVGREFSRNVGFTFSLDLTNAQQQTYLLDLHDIRGIPTLTLQAFTNDRGHEGGTFQQTLEFGGTRLRAGGLPILHRLEIAGESGLAHWRLKRAVALRRGDPVSKTAAFDSEVEAEEALRAGGYPDARATASIRPTAKANRVDLVLTVTPGRKTFFEFTGDRPPAASRRTIRTLYRGDFYEPEAIKEMVSRTVRIFRSLSHPDPHIAISVALPAGADLKGARVVTIRSEAGKKLVIHAPLFPGVPSEESQALAARFAGPVERAELAAGLPDADRRVAGTLRALGHPLGRVISRTLAPDGTLTVLVDEGGVSRIASVAINGVPEEDSRRLLALLPLHVGEPARTDRIAAGTVGITDDFSARGFADVRVNTVVGPASPEDPPPLAVTYDVDPGPSYRLTGVAFEGVRHASRSLLTRVAALSLGSVYRAADIDDARNRLSSIGIFSSIRVETKKTPQGEATTVYTVEEKPRFGLSYGIRWESEVGAAAVVDLLDHDFLGRAITLGLRALYEPNDRAVRLFAGADDLLGTRIGLQSFAEVRRLTRKDLNSQTQGTITDSTEITLQLARAFGPRWNSHVYARYRRSHIFDIELDQFFPLDTTLAYPYAGAQLIYDSRPEPLLPTRGVFASADFSGTGALLSSDFSYLRFFGQLNVYRPLLNFRGRTVSWAQSLRLGFARALAGQDLLPDVRFFAGGEFSVRGYERDTLGPVETLGDFSSVTGGSTLFVLNEELRVPLSSRLIGVVFFDMGQVWESSREFGSNLAKSLGLGVRAITPLGILRLDVARPLDRREGDSSYKVYAGFGNTF